MKAKKTKNVNESVNVGLLASEVVNSLKKAYGASILRSAAKTPPYRRVQTGIFPLDLGLGGGFALGRIHNVYGPKSSGKSTLYLLAIAELQRLCSKCFQYEPGHPGKCGEFTPHICVWLDVEGTFDVEWAAKQGIDIDALLLCTPDFAEQGIDVADALIRSGEVHAIVVDSIAMLTPAKEVEESASKVLMGNQPKLLSMAMRKFSSALNAAANEGRKPPTIFLTNQIRYKLGLLFGNPETQPGGMAAGFAASTETRVQQNKTESDEDTLFSTKTKVTFKVEKNKTFGPKISGEYYMAHNEPGYKEGAFIWEESWWDWAERTGYMTGAVKKTINGRVFAKKDEVLAALQERNDPWTKKVYDDVLKLAVQSYGSGTQKSSPEVDEPAEGEDEQGEPDGEEDSIPIGDQKNPQIGGVGPV